MKKSIAVKNTPVRLPINSTILHLFLLYHFNAPEWLWASYCILATFIWTLLIIAKLNQEYVTYSHRKNNQIFKKILEEIEKNFKR